jgi:hypothetical protein
MEKMRIRPCSRYGLRASIALAFLLPFVAAAGREGEDGHPVMTVNGDAHVAIEAV